MIFILSGTKDSRIIIKNLLDRGHVILASTSTDYGSELIENHENLKVISANLNQKDMENIIISHGIKLLIDATHPYAQEVSINAINAAKNLSVSYFRYERKKVDYQELIKYPSFRSAAKALENCKENILLTIGSNNIDYFSYLNTSNNIYVRVLPTVNSIKKCLSLGFSPKNIIGIQGPFSKNFNKEMYKQFNIKYVVTKDSGYIGGTREKIDAALECGVKVIIIERPEIEYENIYFDIDNLINDINTLK